MPDQLEYRAVTTPDGFTTIDLGSSHREGIRWTQAGVVCVAAPRYLTSCGAVFRNPGGTLAAKNEYLAVYDGNFRNEFSVVK